MIVLPYIIEVQICFAVLWLSCQVILRGDRRFGRRRAALLAIPALSLLIPALSIPLWPAAIDARAVIPVVVTVVTPDAAVQPGFRYGDVLLVIYAAGSLCLTSMCIVQLLRIARLIRLSPSRMTTPGCSIIHTGSIRGAMTAGRYILINSDGMDDEALRQVEAHEHTHVRLGHSYDLVLAQISVIALWWNPAVWLWRRSLKEAHEYQADESVLRQGFDTERYASLLIHDLTGIHPEFVSGFGYSLIKKRLTMISKTKSTRGAAPRLLAALPVTAILLTLFSFSAKTASAEIAGNPMGQAVAADHSPQAFNAPVDSAGKQQKSPVDKTVEKMPAFQGGGVDNFYKWVMQNLSYPSQCAQSKISGKVIVKFTVTPDGTLANVEAVQSPHQALADEAVRVIKMSPAWEPGTQNGKAINVEFQLPVIFSLQ